MSLLSRVFGKKLAKRLNVRQRFQLDHNSVTGTVSKYYSAKEIATGNVFGLKLIDPKKTESQRSRYKDLKLPLEGLIAESIKHEFVVETYEHGRTTDNNEYILMEHLSGPRLDILFSRETELPLKYRLRMVIQLAKAIHHVHESGYVHRDICPRNVICSRDLKSLKLIDFHLALPNQPQYRTRVSRSGTPHYMAPEIVRRKPADHRVDIFSFGITAFQILTAGQHPWGETDNATQAALTFDTVEPKQLSELNPNVPSGFADTIQSCLKAKPDDRPSTMGRVLRALR